MVSARITSKGQVTIPKRIREELDIGPGDNLDFRVEDGRVIAEPRKRRSITEFRGMFAGAKPISEDEARSLWRQDIVDRYLRSVPPDED